MSAQKIKLRIEKITVEGGRPSRAALAAAIKGELGRLLAEPGAIQSLRGAGWTPHLDGGRIVPKTHGETALGNAVAHATLGALKR